MVSDNPTLNACLDVANDFETALNSLGDTSQWPADHALRQRCAEFRYAARDLAEQKGLNQFAIAFIGPKNAGKTTLLSLLLRSKTIKEQLASGEGIRGTTEKIQWISSEPISDLDRRVEESVHIVPSDVAKLGCDYTLIDVPGANEAHPLRAAAAARALRTAHLKVLVAEARTIEDASLLDYLQDADGATILPVINQIRPGTGDQDISGFLDRLQSAIPNSRLLSPLRVPDFQLAGQTESAVDAAEALQRRLRDVVRAEHLDELLEPQLLRMKTRFQDEMHGELSKALPATAEAAQELQHIESHLAVDALERLLGADDRDRAVIAGLRQQLRGLFQQRSPVLFFPWRAFVGLANLLHGALEKVPLLLVGSLPSLVGSAMTAVKNVTQRREFNESRSEGLRKHAELLVKESLHPRVDHLEAAIRSDLRSPQQADYDSLEVEFEGLERLQSRSSELFQEVLDAQAPSRVATWITGLIGLAIFWSIFIWPFISLYKDYFNAVNDFVSKPVDHTIFPKDSFSIIGTSFLLAVFPMLLWLVLVLSWVASRARAIACLRRLRHGHQAIIEDLNAKSILRVRARHPRLQACLKLFSKRT